MKRKRDDEVLEADDGELEATQKKVLVVDATKTCETSRSFLARRRISPRISVRPTITTVRQTWVQYSTRVAGAAAGLRTRGLDPRTTRLGFVTTPTDKDFAYHRVGKHG